MGCGSSANVAPATCADTHSSPGERGVEQPDDRTFNPLQSRRTPSSSPAASSDLASSNGSESVVIPVAHPVTPDARTIAVDSRRTPVLSVLKSTGPLGEDHTIDVMSGPIYNEKSSSSDGHPIIPEFQSLSRCDSTTPTPSPKHSHTASCCDSLLGSAVDAQTFNQRLNRTNDDLIWQQRLHQRQVAVEKYEEKNEGLEAALVFLEEFEQKLEDPNTMFECPVLAIQARQLLRNGTMCGILSHIEALVVDFAVITQHMVREQGSRAPQQSIHQAFHVESIFASLCAFEAEFHHALRPFRAQHTQAVNRCKLLQIVHDSTSSSTAPEPHLEDLTAEDFRLGLSSVIREGVLLVKVYCTFR